MTKQCQCNPYNCQPSCACKTQPAPTACRCGPNCKCGDSCGCTA